MSYLIVIGIILLSIGSFVTYLGSKNENDESQKQVNDKLDNFNKKLDAISNSSLTPVEKEKKISTIKSEFDIWAKQLHNNYSELVLLHDKKILSASEEKLVKNKKWIPIFRNFFDKLIQMIKSINKETSFNTIKIHSSSSTFPRDVFTDEVEEYFKILEFSTEDFLKVKVSYLKSQKKHIPFLNFECYDDFEEAKTDFGPRNQLTIFFNDDDTFHISTEGSFDTIEFELSKENNSKCSIDNITDLLKKIIQHQLIISSKKTVAKRPD